MNSNTKSFHDDLMSKIDEKSHKFIKNVISDDMIKGKYKNDFALIKLTQKTLSKPLLFTGPGTIYQDENGLLFMDLYHVYSKRRPQKFQMINTKPGELIGEEYYFKLHATDMSGNKWTADNVWVNSNETFPSAGNVFKFQLKSISTWNYLQDETEKFEIKLMVKGKVDTPPSKWVTFPDGSRTRAMHLIEYNKIMISTISTETALYIHISGKINFYKKHFYNIVLEAIGIATGRLLMPSTLSVTYNNRHTYTIQSVSNKHYQILSPAVPYFEMVHFTDLICKYLNKFKKPWSTYYYNWMKIYRSTSTSVENTALIQCVAIESILKEYYKSSGIPTKKEKQIITKAIKLITDSSLDAKMTERITGLVSSMKNQNARRALIELNKKGIISKQMVNSWKKRNELAHGKRIIIDSKTTFQKIIDDSDSVLSLLYMLLFKYIGYTGKHYNYSKPGWPIEIIGNFNKNAATEEN